MVQETPLLRPQLIMQDKPRGLKHKIWPIPVHAHPENHAERNVKPGISFTAPQYRALNLWKFMAMTDPVEVDDTGWGSCMPCISSHLMWGEVNNSLELSKYLKGDV